MGQPYAFRVGSCVTVGLVFFSICVSIQAHTSPGFISIDCGGSPFNDTVTTISWESDDNYTSSGMSGTVPITVDTTLDNYQALKTFRYFPDGRSKYCYDLPTTSSNISFLLRAMFLQGSASELTLPITFSLAINGTTWSTINYDNVDAFSDTLNTPIVHEGIFHSPGSLTHICLVSDVGVPFISSLELREFTTDNLMYSFPGSNEVYLSRLWRYNCGDPLGNPTVRYPDDKFDRLWATPGNWSNIPITSGTADNSTSSTSNYVPSAVMKDAWVESKPNTSFFFSFSLDTFAPAPTLLYIAVYFEELDSTAVVGDRLFNVEINGESNSIEEIAPVQSGVQLYTLNDFSAFESVNMTFAATASSEFGPIVNALEVYYRYGINDSTTATQDVDGLAALQVSFNLTDWQGDPCYPVSWDWVRCTGEEPARVYVLSLSSMGIDAVIPPSISNLTALTAIHLDNNSLHGTIPDSLASLPNLTFLALDDNNLSGEVPAALITKLGTNNFLFYGNPLLANSSPNPPSNSSNSPAGSPKKKSSSSIGVIIGAAAGGAVVLVVLVCFLVCCLWKGNAKPEHRAKVEIETSGMGSRKPPSEVDKDPPGSPYLNQSTTGERVSFETVRKATNNFTREIGKGSFGSVYLGLLNNKEVAVKMHNIKSDQGRQEFITEVDILRRVHHRNLVSLVAFCDDGTDLTLIYEFEVNGTLREWLYASDGKRVRGALDWKTRLQIASDAAEGLEYLHKMCVPPVIHRDVKSSNILLDQSMTGKVGDFGLSKATPFDKTSGFSTKVKGTHGYLDLEYHQLGKVTYKSDVFSYGVVLAEIITGMPPYRIDEEGQPFLLVEFVNRMVKTNDMQTLADPKLEGAYNMEAMWKMAELVLSCTNRVGALRPEFTEVVSTIKEAIEIEKSFAIHSPFLTSSGSFSLTSQYQILQ